MTVEANSLKIFNIQFSFLLGTSPLQLVVSLAVIAWCCLYFQFVPTFYVSNADVHYYVFKI